MTVEYNNKLYVTNGARLYEGVVPEPGTLSLMGLAGLALMRRKRK